MHESVNKELINKTRRHLKKTCFCTILDLEKSISKQSAMFCRAANWVSSSDRREENQTVGGVDAAPWGPTIWVFMAWQTSESGSSSAACGGIPSGSLSTSTWLIGGDSSGTPAAYRSKFYKPYSASLLISLYLGGTHSCIRPSVWRHIQTCVTGAFQDIFWHYDNRFWISSSSSTTNNRGCKHMKLSGSRTQRRNIWCFWVETGWQVLMQGMVL